MIAALTVFLPLIRDAFAGAGKFFIFLFIRKSAQQELHNEQLKSQAKVQKTQLNIAAQPATSWGDILKRMRKGER